MADGYHLMQVKGPHLTEAGLSKVAKNLKLVIKTGITDVTRFYTSRTSTSDVSQSDMNRKSSYHDCKPSYVTIGTAKGAALPKDWYQM